MKSSPLLKNLLGSQRLGKKIFSFSQKERKDKIFSYFGPYFRGFTLIDVLIGTALMLIVFLGIFGAYQLGIKAIGQSRNKITALAIANQQLEEVRNLPYESIGVKGSFPNGVLEAVTSTWQNNIEYTIENRVDFVIDSADGLSSPEDECPNDYKRVETKVSWGGRFPGEVKLVTDVAPKNLAQECAVEGGILSILVFDAYGKMVPFPLIEIKNPETEEVLKTATPSDGQHYFSLATSTYKVVVSKEGYSQERTYGLDEIAIPEKPHPLILEGQLIENSFSIDKLSAFSLETLSPWGADYFFDSFDDTTKISEISALSVNQGEVNLATTSQGYLSSGYLISQEISPTNLVQWDELVFADSEPAETDLKYQIYYATNTSWLLIPDSDLAGNSQGFDLSPVDLSGLEINQYFFLKVRGNFSTNTTTTSPTLYDWQVSWITDLPTPIPNVTFNLRGEKIIGLDAEENPVYKYSQDHTSNSQGQLEIADLEWDAYTFSIDPATDLDLVATDPSPQPISLLPETTLSVDLYLEGENSLLLTIQDSSTLEPIFDAACRLSNSELAYDLTQHTNEKGQTYFIPLEPASYNLEISAPGYFDYFGEIEVSGDERETLKLEQLE